MARKNHGRLVAAVVGVIGTAAFSTADSGTWSATPADGNWANTANWVDGVVPGGVGTTASPDVATFGTTGVPAVNVDAGRNVSDLVFNSTTAYTLGGGPLVLTNGGTTVATNGLTSSGGTGIASTIAAPVVIAGDGGGYTFESNAGGSALLNVGGGVTGSSTGANVTTLTLTGTGGGLNAVGVIGDGTGGGRVALVKNGTGQWSLSAAPTFTGGITVNAGTLRTALSGNSTASLGNNTITFNGGFVRLGGTAATTYNSTAVVTAAGGGISFRTNSGFSPAGLTGTGTLTLTSDQATATITPTTFGTFAGTINVTNTAATPVGGTIIRLAQTNFDNASLANVTFNLNANTFFNRQNGTNQVNNAAATASVGGLSGTAGSFGGSAAGNGNFVYNVGSNNQNTTFGGFVVNGGTLTTLGKVGTGTLTLTGANSYSAGTILTAGTLNVNGINALGGANYGVNNATIGAANPALRFNGGTLQYAPTLTSSGDLSTNPGTNAAAAVTFTATAVIDTNGNTVTYANSVGNGGAGGLTKTGAGTLTLTSSNYTGTTTVQAGQLTLNTAAQNGIFGATPAGADVQGGRLSLDYTGGTSPVAQVKAVLDAGYAEPAKFSTGPIRSTTLAAGRTLGYADTGSAVVITVTIPGDADLNGQVDFADFVALQSSFGGTDTRFDQGNFDYDGDTDFADFVALQSNFGQSINGGRVAIGRAEYDRVMGISSAGQVPEPTTLALAGVTAAGLLRRRRA